MIPLREFRADVVQTPLKGLLTNMHRDLERQLGLANQSRDKEAERRLSLLLMMLNFTINSYEAVCFLISTEGDDPKRKSNFALVVPPINRQLMDLLFSLVYIIDEFPARSLAYELSGYRQLREEYDRFYGRFGTHPEWQQHLTNLKDVIQTLEKYLPISPEQQHDLTSIHYWKSPSWIRNFTTPSQPFLQFIFTWLYDDTSAQAHLNAGGLMAVGAIVLSSVAPDDMRKVIEERIIQQYTYRHFTRVLISVLSIASEIETCCGLGNREAAVLTWGLLNGYVEEAKDVYERRYQAMLTQTSHLRAT